MTAIVDIRDLRKTYPGGFEALKGVTLAIEEGEILALLGPNGAGKTTLISTICGITNPGSGSVTVSGYDVVRNYRDARRLIGLVPQEINLDLFTKVFDSVKYSRGLFGKSRDDAYVEKILRQLSLWDKRDARTMQLSGGMKRRVMIAKALAHEPRVLFLDEPTAGVDVELRKDMWKIVAGLKADGVTIILTTHYIEEAEAIADRVGVINKGELLLLEDKNALMQRFGQKHLQIDLQEPVHSVPEALGPHNLTLGANGTCLHYSYDSQGERTGITTLLNDIAAAGLVLRDIRTKESSLEEIFVSLVSEEVA